MSYQIILELEDVSGALIRVMSCLRKQGLRTVSQNLENRPDGSRNLSLEVEGPQLSDTVLRSALEAVNGVARLLAGGSNESESSKPKAEVAAEPADTRFKDKNSEAGDVEIRDKMLIFSLLSRYPNISARLVEINSSIPEEDRYQRLLELGEGFGKHLVKNLKVQEAAHDMRSAIESVLFPALSPLVQIAQYSDGVQISGYTKNMKHAANKPECCEFIKGTIQGLLHGSVSLPPHQVTKEDCIHGDDDACRYALTAA